MNRRTFIARVADRLLAVPLIADAPEAARLRGVRRRLVLPVVTAALAWSIHGAAQMEAPGELVTIPGTMIADCCLVTEVSARFGRPASSTDKIAAVLILHGTVFVQNRTPKCGLYSTDRTEDKRPSFKLDIHLQKGSNS